MTFSRRGVLAGAASAAWGQEPARKRIRLGLIGTGHRGWAFIQVLKALPDFELTAMADPTPEFATRAAELAGPGVRRYSSWQELLARETQIEGVIVVTPTFLHAEPTIAALGSGRHVLCEKPMALSLEQADQMIGASRTSGKILQIGLQMRYDPLYRAMFDRVKGGDIGALQFASGTLFRGDWNPRSWKYTNPKTGVAANWRFLSSAAGSSLMEDGIHELDVLHWMTGSRVARIYAAGGNNVLKDRETIDHASLSIEYENGVKIAFQFCIFAPNAGPVTRHMMLAGETGNLQSEIGKLVLRRKTGEVRDVAVSRDLPANATAVQAGPDQDTGTYRQLAAFAESIRTGTKPFCSGETAREVLKIALLAEKSIRERRIVTWQDLQA